MKRARLLLGAPLVMAALLAACSSGPQSQREVIPTAAPGITNAPSYLSTNGPLGDGRTAGGGCFRMALGRPVTMGNFDLHDMGDSPVTITGITLRAPYGLRMTSAWLIPIVDRGPSVMLGIAGGPYPPNLQEWADRQPLVGAVIRPQQGLILVFGLIRTNAMANYGRSAGPKITYTSAGRTYTVNEQATLTVAANCSHLTD